MPPLREICKELSGPLFAEAAPNRNYDQNSLILIFRQKWGHANFLKGNTLIKKGHRVI